MHIETGRNLPSQIVSGPILASEFDLSDLLACLGRSSFEAELAKLLARTLGADQIHIFRGAVDEPAIIASISTDGSKSAQRQSELYINEKVWRFDSELTHCCESIAGRPTVFRFDTGQPQSREMKAYYEFVDMGERVVAVGNGPEGRLCLAAIWSRLYGALNEEQVHKLRVLGDLAFPMLAQHYSLLHERRDLPKALTSLRVIEQCLTLSPENFPKREADVVARIIYGLSAEGIALDLGISPETVICYRRRFYQRFGISCFRELVVWYINLYGQIEHFRVEH